MFGRNVNILFSSFINSLIFPPFMLHKMSPAQKQEKAMKLRNAIIISEINMLSDKVPVLVILHQSRMQENIDN